MGDYDDAAAAARDRGVIDRADVAEWQVRADLQRYLNVENPNDPAGQKLIERTTQAAMEQRVRDADGQVAGKRRNLKTWEDRWGNVMAENRETGRRTKLVDREERGL